MDPFDDSDCWSSKSYSSKLNTSHKVSKSINPVNNSTLLALDKELQKVKDENRKLKLQLHEEKSLLEQIVNENKEEKYDERRINILKCQVIQLERQILLLTEALGTRSTNILEIENALQSILDDLRYYITADVKGSHVPVNRADLMKMVQICESSRIKLFKGIENNSKENMSKPTLFINNFIKKKDQQNLTLFDICSGENNHINLKEVGKLESKLSLLYKDLIHLKESLAATECDITSTHLPSCIKERVCHQIEATSNLCKDCTLDLMSLSLLYPVAPWSVLKRPIITDIKLDDILCALPNLPKSKTSHIHQLIENLLKVANYRQMILEKEVQALRTEVRFHQCIYTRQLTYVQDLFEAVRTSYHGFEQSLNSMVIGPLKNLLENYEKLVISDSDKALKEFLLWFKSNEHQLQTIIDKLESSKDEDNSDAIFSSFEKELFDIIEELVQEQQSKRNVEINQRQELKEEKDRLEDHLRQFIQTSTEQKLLVRQKKDLQEEISLEINPTSSATNSNMPMENIEKSKVHCVPLAKVDHTLKKLEKPLSGKDKLLAPVTVNAPVTKNAAATKTIKSYEPNLIVPNKTLKLKSNSSIKPIDVKNRH